MASPTFNFTSFCKVLLVDEVNEEIGKLFKNQQSIVTQEIFKLLMNQISSLKKLVFYRSYEDDIPKFTSFSRANNCLKDLTYLCCYSNNNPELLYQLSQICRNIQSLRISFVKVISNGLADLISSQQNLKCLNLFLWYECKSWTTDIITSLKNLPNTLTKLVIRSFRAKPLSFIARLTNLQEITLTFNLRMLLKILKNCDMLLFHICKC